MTKREMDMRVDVIAEMLGVKRNKADAIEANHTKFLYIDYAQCYGGYVLVLIGVTNGAHYDFYSSSRKSNKEFTAYLEGIISGIYKFKQGVL